MKQTITISLLLFLSVFMTSCATVPMESTELDQLAKQFSKPSKGKSGLYVYRDTFVGQALKKDIKLDGEFFAESANKVYFFKEISPGEHVLSTESEFSDNSVNFIAVEGVNYYFEQYIKMGLFVGGAGLKGVTEDDGKVAVINCLRAKTL